jgi:hypothetical protein
MEELVQQRLAAMLAQPADKLRLLPACFEEVVILEGRKTKVTTYCQTRGNRRWLIIQAAQERLGGIAAKVIASGYELSDSGNPRKLAADELYDYT